MNCLDPVFAKELKFYYGSDVEGVQFTRDPVRAWGRINKFVEDKTNGIVADFMQRLVGQACQIVLKFNVIIVKKIRLIYSHYFGFLIA